MGKGKGKGKDKGKSDKVKRKGSFSKGRGGLLHEWHQKDEWLDQRAMICFLIIE